MRSLLVPIETPTTLAEQRLVHPLAWDEWLSVLWPLVDEGSTPRLVALDVVTSYSSMPTCGSPEDSMRSRPDHDP